MITAGLFSGVDSLTFDYEPLFREYFTQVTALADRRVV
jgi:hypothetical protein